MSSTPTPAPGNDEFDTMQIDRVEADASNEFIGSASEAEDEDLDHSQSDAICQANDHDSLKWAVGHQAAPSWTNLGSVRHSNIIQFEFQISVRRWVDLESTIAEYASATAIPVQSAFLLRSEQLLQLASLWVPEARPLARLNFAGSECVSILFYTGFDQSTWQIKRVLLCIIWQRSSSESSLVAEDVHQVHLSNSNFGSRINQITDLRGCLLDVQRISGRTSVSYALQNVTMLLSQKHDELKLMLGNIPHTETQLPGTFANRTILTEIAILVSPDSRSSDGVQLEQCSSSIPPGLLLDTRTGNSMLIVRSDSWPVECPKFYLFVLLDEYPNDSEHLYQLLKEARTQNFFYGDYNYKLSRADGQILRDWSKALKDCT
jgi:hypothetical protein